ncbi:MAG TPA: hypothetical protein VGC24_01595 [Burkholderiaceae bacterium]
MEKIIVYVDDAAYAQQQLTPMQKSAGQPGPHLDDAHWILVACAPRMTHRVSKWVSHSARENWRTKWTDKLFAQLVPALQAHGGQVSTVVAKGPLTELTAQLHAEYGSARVLDARRPKLGHDMQPVTPEQPQATGKDNRWSVPGAVLGLFAALVLAAE